MMAEPPYAPLVTSFELVGALTAHEIRAVGLRSDERPAVKRGTLWYLDERVFGKGVGVDDPFVRCRVDAGLSPSEKDGIYVRGPITSTTSSSYQALPTFLHDEDEDETGMGRGKRKRRASSAAMSMTDSAITASPGSIATPAHSTTTWTPPMHRRSTSGAIPTPKPIVPRLRLRLTSLEEVDSMDDSDAGSDVQSRRQTKKKSRRATSEGVVSKSSSVDVEVPVAIGDEEAEAIRRSAFSSASSSALLAQSLLAASVSTPIVSSPASTTPHPHSNVSPGSLHLATAAVPPRRPNHHLSASAPNLLSVLHDRLSPDAMDAEFQRAASEDSPDSSAGDDFHESMLRGEDFDFEWGSESYTASDSLPAFSQKSSKGKVVEGSVPPEVEEVDLNEEFNDEMEDDASSTPATTPRSPAREEDPEVPAGSLKGGLEATLCEAFEEVTEETKPVLQLISEYSRQYSHSVSLTV